MTNFGDIAVGALRRATQKFAKTPDSIYTDNYYYVQVFTDMGETEDNIYGTTYYTVCFAPNVDSAKTTVNIWLDDLKVVGKRDINLYHKNYKVKSKGMVAEGNYITNY